MIMDILESRMTFSTKNNRYITERSNKRELSEEKKKKSTIKTIIQKKRIVIEHNI